MPAVDRKGKYQPWSHEEFVSDPRVRRMTPLARKTYMTLLHEAFVCSTRPYLPDDDEELELLADCSSPEEWRSVQVVVLGMFRREEVDGQDVLCNKRLVQDWDTLLDIREKRSEAGKASGLARRAKSNKCSEGVEHETNKEVKRREVSEENLSEGTDMRAEKQILIACQNIFGSSPRLYDTHKAELKRLEAIHKGSAVARAFEEWAGDVDETPSNPVAAFLSVADDRLSGGGQLQNAAKAPEVVSLVRELTYLSDGKVKFADRQKPLLAELAGEYPQTEILAVFRAWLDDHDLSDPRTVQYAAKNFVECADALCYSARRKKQERSEADVQREAAKLRLQEEAEAERVAAETEKKSEEDIFDPLADETVVQFH